MPLQLYGYRTVTADLYLHAFPGGYTGIDLELLKFLGGIIAPGVAPGYRHSKSAQI